MEIEAPRLFDEISSTVHHCQFKNTIENVVALVLMECVIWSSCHFSSGTNCLRFRTWGIVCVCTSDSEVIQGKNDNYDFFEDLPYENKLCHQMLPERIMLKKQLTLI